MKWAVRSLADLGPGLVLAPERHVVTELAGAGGGAHEELALERIERVSPREIAEGEVVVLDTTHAKDGVLDVPSARLASRQMSSLIGVGRSVAPPSSGRARATTT